MILTKQQFDKRFPDDNACLAELWKIKYENLDTCPSCAKKARFHRVGTRKVYVCQWCGKQISPTKGSIFEKSPTPLKDWFYVMYLMTTTRSGISAKEVERQLGVTYKCAWRMCHQIRALMGKDSEGHILSGHVEIDEIYMGGKHRGKRGRGAAGKTPVFGMVQRDGRVIAKTVSSTKKKNILPLIQKYIAKGITISSDEYRVYKGLKYLGFNHEAVHHAIKEYVRGEVHTNKIEGFWSQLKRSISGTHVFVSPQHLQKYVDEFVFRYNNRQLVNTTMIDAMLKNA